VKIISLEIENILSIEKASLSFKDNGLVLVEGWNHDTGRANGAGKTAIFNALSFALYDKIPRKVTASEILRRGSKSGRVTCVVDIGGEIWTICRSRPKGVTYSSNNELKTITQEEWEAKIRLTYDQFLMSMYTAQRSDTISPRFLLTTDSDKKGFLLQLLNLNVFDDCKKVVNKKISESESSILRIQSAINNDTSKVQAYSESLVDETTINGKIKQLLDNCGKVKAEIRELSSVPKPDLSKYSSLEENIRSKSATFASTRARRSSLSDSYRELSSLIKEYDSDIKCGECGASLDTKEAKIKHQEHQNKILERLQQTKIQIDECDQVLSGESNIKDLIKKLNQKKLTESQAYDEAVSRMMELKSFIKISESKVKELQEKLTSNLELTDKIKALTESISKNTNLLSKENNNLEILKIVASLYSPTGAQAYILDSVIDFFNSSVSKYIELMWPTATYSLNSYKETSKGDVSAKFSESLTMDGSEVSVGSLSGGELKALSLCVDFAILDILESQFSISLNPIILDEPFEGLDSIGRELVIELLDKLSKDRLIMVVDHASEAKAMFSEVIKIEKKNGISSVRVET
jgi:DNA repair exonuclease SbcCD ATPase subunit